MAMFNSYFDITRGYLPISSYIILYHPIWDTCIAIRDLFRPRSPALWISSSSEARRSSVSNWRFPLDVHPDWSSIGSQEVKKMCRKKTDWNDDEMQISKRYQRTWTGKHWRFVQRNHNTHEPAWKMPVWFIYSNLSKCHDRILSKCHVFLRISKVTEIKDSFIEFPLENICNFHFQRNHLFWSTWKLTPKFLWNILKNAKNRGVNESTIMNFATMSPQKKPGTMRPPPCDSSVPGSGRWTHFRPVKSDVQKKWWEWEFWTSQNMIKIWIPKNYIHIFDIIIWMINIINIYHDKIYFFDKLYEFQRMELTENVYLWKRWKYPKCTTFIQSGNLSQSIWLRVSSSYPATNSCRLWVFIHPNMFLQIWKQIGSMGFVAFLSSQFWPFTCSFGLQSGSFVFGAPNAIAKHESIHPRNRIEYSRPFGPTKDKMEFLARQVASIPPVMSEVLP